MSLYPADEGQMVFVYNIIMVALSVSLGLMVHVWLGAAIGFAWVVLLFYHIHVRPARHPEEELPTEDVIREHFRRFMSADTDNLKKVLAKQGERLAQLEKDLKEWKG